MNRTVTEQPGVTTVTTPSKLEIHTERVFNAWRDRVWRAFTDATQLAQWWGRGNKLVIEKNEVERGGHWRYVEHSPEGTQGFEGQFREVTPPERMVQTFEWDGMPGHALVTTVNFEDAGDGRTLVSSNVRFHSAEERDEMLRSGMTDGMNESYEALDRLLAREAEVSF
jgi:uncharacterized protein YndB with AHSA1/START domain